MANFKNVRSTPVNGSDDPPRMEEGLLEDGDQLDPEEQGDPEEQKTPEAEKKAEPKKKPVKLYVLVLDDDTGMNARVVAGDPGALYKALTDFATENDQKIDSVLTYELGKQVNICMSFEIQDVK